MRNLVLPEMLVRIEFRAGKTARGLNKLRKNAFSWHLRRYSIGLYYCGSRVRHGQFQGRGVMRSLRVLIRSNLRASITGSGQGQRIQPKPWLRRFQLDHDYGAVKPFGGR
jgi:hypothetical protein